MSIETLYEMPSINCYINEDLIVYPKDYQGEPDITQWNELENLSSTFVNQISKDDDSLLSELIYWKVRTDESKIYYE